MDNLKGIINNYLKKSATALSASKDSNIKMKATQRHRKVRGIETDTEMDRQTQGWTICGESLKGRQMDNLQGHNKFLLEVICHGFVRFKGQ